MQWKSYQKRFKIACFRKDIPQKHVQVLLNYAQNLNAQDLPIIYDVEHLSRLVGYNKIFLYSLSNGTNKFYRRFSIPKNNGDQRIINEPYPSLKEIQKWILDNILVKVPVSRYAKAYLKGKTIIDNVKFHKAQPIVLKLDVENFFDSIGIVDVVTLFMKMGYTKKLSVMLANLCCLENKLPQGSPTSPYLSNLYCKGIDKRIGNYAIKLGLRYTRYSDDITISGRMSDSQIKQVINICTKVLIDNRLKLKESKTQILRRSNRQVVTGVVLNEKISAGTKTKRDIRQSLFYIKKFGVESHIKHTNNEQARYLNHMLGRINWVLQLEKNNEEFLGYKTFLSEVILHFYK